MIRIILKLVTIDTLVIASAATDARGNFQHCPGDCFVPRNEEEILLS